MPDARPSTFVVWNSTASQALVDQIGRRSARPESDARRCQKAAGNPLFITELLGAFDEDEAMDDRRRTGRDRRGRLCRRSCDLTILRRLGFLSDAALAALRAASILGSGFTLADLSVTTAQPAIDLASRVAEALCGAGSSKRTATDSASVTT